jgi:soluble lytic murein transglycosylase-like protein
MSKYFFLALFIFSSASAWAGNQQYENLDIQTRGMMSRLVADEPPKFSSFDSNLQQQAWIAGMSEHLSRFVKTQQDRDDLLMAVHYEASRAGLDPELVLGLMQVESGFEKYAVSSVGARGYMQVMPFWINEIGDKTTNLFYMRTNLRFGCTILRHYLDMEHGNLFMALGRYNGSRGQASYPNAVMAATRQFKNNTYAKLYQTEYLTKN